LRIVLVDGFDSSDDEGLNTVVDNFASVLGRKHQMVVSSSHFSEHSPRTFLVLA